MSFEPKIVELKTEPAQRVDEVISTLARALDEARAGDVVAVGMFVVRPDGHANCCFTNHFNATAMLGGVSLLQARLMANIENWAPYPEKDEQA